MSKILNLAQDFEQKSKQQAQDTERRLKNEFERHEKSIERALKSSEQTINDAIRAQSQRMTSLVLKSWIWILISVVLVMFAIWGTILYQGIVIAKNFLDIERQQETLNQLEKKTFGLTLFSGTKGNYIVLPENLRAETGWTVGNKQAIKLEKN